MSHIVIHEDSNNGTHYAEFDDVQEAVAHLEQLVNEDSGANARLFALEPVEFAVKSYVKVEINSADTDPPAPVSAAIEAPPVEMLDEPSDDTVAYVEAAMAPIDHFAPKSPDAVDGNSSGEVRRGLFGR